MRILHNIILLFVLMAFSLELLAQTPQSFSYQAVARDASGNSIISKQIGIRISVLDNTATGTALYTETHTPTTNNVGLFALEIGKGAPSTGTFNTLDWGTNKKFLKVEMDAAGGTNYTTVGTTELLSVPYALYAEKVNPTNLPTDKDQQNLSLTGNQLNISGGNTVTLPSGGVPKVTNAEMFALPSPQLGDVVFNTSIKGICFYADGNWKYAQPDENINVLNAPNATNMLTFLNRNLTQQQIFSIINGTVGDCSINQPTFQFSYSSITAYDGFCNQNAPQGFFQETTLTSAQFNSATIADLNALDVNVSDYSDIDFYYSSPVGKVYAFITSGYGVKKALIRINSYGDANNVINISVKAQQ